jgi:tetratricopeptide (TPR) repeat protein
LIDVCYNLGLTYSRLANVQKNNSDIRAQQHNAISLATKYYAMALNMRTEQDVVYADNVYNIGVSYIADSSDEIGLFFIAKALDIYKAVADDPDEYASALNFYCSLLHTLGYNDKALDAYKLLLDWQTEHFPTAYILLSGTLSSMSKCCAESDDMLTAIEYKKQSIDTILKGFIDKPLMYTMAVAELGALYSEIEDYNQAELQFKEALNVRTYLLSGDDDVCIAYVFALCRIYVKTKQYKNAELLLCHTLDILQPHAPIYTDLTLLLVAIYIQAEDGKGIRKAYELFIKAHPEKGFDEMLDMAEDTMNRFHSTQGLHNLFN